jgi:hypothetical protein
VTVASNRITTNTQGSYGVSFYNDNLLSPIIVSFKGVAMVIDKFWGNVSYDETVSVPLYKYENYREPEVIKTMVPQLGN